MLRGVKKRSVKPTPMIPERDGRKEANELLVNLKKNLPKLEKTLAEVNDMWGVEDCVYRFYHSSFKLIPYQQTTRKVVRELQALLPGHPLNSMFKEIIASGTGIEFQDTTNANWLAETRPIVDAFLHARFFLEMAVKYGRELDFPPNSLPSGWAAILYLFNLR
jgi:hypothetical protein